MGSVVGAVGARGTVAFRLVERLGCERRWLISDKRARASRPSGNVAAHVHAFPDAFLSRSRPAPTAVLVLPTDKSIVLSPAAFNAATSLSNDLVVHVCVMDVGGGGGGGEG